ncbi:MAG: hypothetical protein K5873_07620 [Treponema sp.]|nr:hypothetical protein [Treponema sp.]
MITSFFPGRVRLRAPVFKDDELVEKARSILEKSDAVKNIEHNPLTGSVLIEYHPSKVPMAKLLPMQDFFIRLAKEAENFDPGKKEKISSMLDQLKDIF